MVAPPSSADPRRLARGPLTIAALAMRVTKPILGKRGFVGADILTHWPTIIGAELARFAVPQEVKYPRGRNAGATLILKVANGAAATLLQMKSPAIIERVNRFFGYAAIAQIQSVQGPLPVSPVPVPEPIRDPAPTSLAEALAKLEKAVQHRCAGDVKMEDQQGDHHDR